VPQEDGWHVNGYDWASLEHALTQAHYLAQPMARKCKYTQANIFTYRNPYREKKPQCRMESYRDRNHQSERRHEKHRSGF